ncbi:MAG: hypothetical protein MW689_000596 [Thermodesulfobacteria bacterium]|nr:hypothetical protein [Thermodesulfobacteriota bacterium]
MMKPALHKKGLRLDELVALLEIYLFEMKPALQKKGLRQEIIEINAYFSK